MEQSNKTYELCAFFDKGNGCLWLNAGSQPLFFLTSKEAELDRGLREASNPSYKGKIAIGLVDVKMQVANQEDQKMGADNAGNGTFVIMRAVPAKNGQQVPDTLVADKNTTLGEVWDWVDSLSPPTDGQIIISKGQRLT